MDIKLLTTLCVFTLILGFIALVGTILLPFLPSLGWAGIISIITYPLYRRLSKALPHRVTLSAGIMTATVAIIICIPVVVIITVLSTEIAVLYRFLEQTGTGGLYQQLSPLLQHPLSLQIKTWLEPLLGQLPVDIGTSLMPAAKKAAAVMAGYSATVMKNTFGLFFQLFFMTITLFFCYRDGERVVTWLWSLVPVEPEQRKAVEVTVERVLQAVIFGIFLTCVVQGILGGLGFWAAGLPSPLLSGSIMILTAFIPVIGTALIWAPGGIYLLMQGKLAAGISLLLWGALVVGSIDNLIRPLFISGKAKLPILLVAIGALGGLLAFGLIGVVLGPLLLALPLALLQSDGKGIPATEPETTE